MDRTAHLVSRITALRASAPGLAAEEKQLSDRLESMDVAQGDRLAAYERDTLVARLRLARLRIEHAPRVGRELEELLKLRRRID